MAISVWVCLILKTGPFFMLKLKPDCSLPHAKSPETPDLSIIQRWKEKYYKARQTAESGLGDGGGTLIEQVGNWGRKGNL